MGENYELKFALIWAEGYLYLLIRNEINNNDNNINNSNNVHLIFLFRWDYYAGHYIHRLIFKFQYK